MISENILKFINFNMQNFDFIQTTFFSIITLLILLLILWFIKDLNSRIKNKFLKFLIFLGVLILNLPGFLFYLVLRPRETLDEKQENLLLSKRQETLLLEESFNTCAHCATINKNEFKFCINCGNEMELNCSKCEFNLQPYWSFCPNCKTEILLDLLVFNKITKESKIKKYIKNFKYFLINTLSKIGNTILDLVVKIIVFIAFIWKTIFGWSENTIQQNIDLLKVNSKLNEATINGQNVKAYSNKTQNLKIPKVEIKQAIKPRESIKKLKKKKRKKKH